MMRAVIAHLYNETRTDDTCAQWGEVSGLKYLFHGAQPWTRQQANAFLYAAWNYVATNDAHSRSHRLLHRPDDRCLAAALWVQGQPVLNAQFLRPFGLVVGVIVTIVGVFSRWAWAWPLFRGWYVKRPDLRGTWKAEIQSNWKNPETGSGVPPIAAYLAVRQTLTTLSLRLMTPESKSKLIAHSIELEKDGIYRIAGIYRNEPRVELQGTAAKFITARCCSKFTERRRARWRATIGPIAVRAEP